MSRVKSADTKPEIIVRKYLFSHGIRYSLHSKKLIGKPDIVLRKYNCLIFVNGCFWHGHRDCKKATLPKTRTKWWKQKIEATIQRDKKIKCKLNEDGWKIITVWQCELESKKINDTLSNLINVIKEHPRKND